eukprot:TRINITY_DN9827_c0_g1_i3.p1 TRINITY_DN9827_c0_g1~~TRINITY_DN9827_c0_g1_i3.p1  ORF type:complete len:326 (-),score=61.27 TRINITY_DN9827_c0_g1_i3:26-1003(-)
MLRAQAGAGSSPRGCRPRACGLRRAAQGLAACACGWAAWHVPAGWCCRLALAAALVVVALSTLCRAYVRLLRYLGTQLPEDYRSHMGETYHGKVMTLAQAQKLVSVDADMSCDLGERILPYTTARELVLKAPVTVGAIDCPCRMSKKEHCNPTRVCMIFGEGLLTYFERTRGKSFVTRFTREQALQLLEDEHRRGHVHTAYFKDELNGFFALCNCCKCCCAGLEMTVKRGIPCIAPSGYVASVDADRCVGCGQCTKCCPFGAVTAAEGQKPRVDPSACKGCGVCVGCCPHGALSLRRDETTGDPLDIEEIRRSCATADNQSKKDN